MSAIPTESHGMNSSSNFSTFLLSLIVFIYEAGGMCIIISHCALGLGEFQMTSLVQKYVLRLLKLRWEYSPWLFLANVSKYQK